MFTHITRFHCFFFIGIFGLSFFNLLYWFRHRYSSPSTFFFFVLITFQLCKEASIPLKRPRLLAVENTCSESLLEPPGLAYGSVALFIELFFARIRRATWISLTARVRSASVWCHHQPDGRLRQAPLDHGDSQWLITESRSSKLWSV